MNSAALDTAVKRRFALPAAIVLGAHAVLLFGFVRPLSIPASSLLPAPATPADPMTVSISDEVLTPDPNDPPQAKPGSPRPQLPDYPSPISPDSHPITVPMSPHPVERVPKIPVIGPWTGGKPGPGDGSGTEFCDPGSLDQAPHATVQPSPDYPSAAKSEDLRGRVVVEFVVDQSGRVRDPRVVSSTSPVFEEATLRAVAHWRFAPGRRHGVPVSFRMSLPVTFNLDE